MKTLAEIESRNEPRADKERLSESSANPVGELVHDLFNQLTVMNLCGANLSVSWQDSDDPRFARNLDMLKRAAEEATKLAERIAQLTAGQKPRSAVQVA